MTAIYKATVVDAQMVEDYAAIVLRQETGLNVFGEPVERYQAGDRDFLRLVEDNVDLAQFSLNDVVGSKFQIQAEYLAEMTQND